jgi:hypothetical protein
MFIEDPVERGVKQAFRKFFNGGLFSARGNFSGPGLQPGGNPV